MNSSVATEKYGAPGHGRRAESEKEGHEKAPRQWGSSSISDETYYTINMISSGTAKVNKNQGFLRFFTAIKILKLGDDTHIQASYI